MHNKIYPLVRGLASYIVPRKYFVRPGSGGTFSSKYCYSVWLRHLVTLHDAGLIKDLSEINKIAEIGPGDSLGIGMAALFTGANEYYGFDVIKHANLQNNLAIAEELKQHFDKRLSIPHKEKQLQNIKPCLFSYEFPKILNDQLSSESLTARLHDIRKALHKEGEDRLKIEYIVPWYEKESNLKGQLDLIFSQAVMEHVDNIEHAYLKMYEWLKPGGIISHQIDYKAHEMSNEWNGHWYISRDTWEILLHGRKYSINRLPHSAHVNQIKKAGFKIINIIPDIRINNFKERKPVVPGIEFSESDMTIDSALIQAVKL